MKIKFIPIDYDYFDYNGRTYAKIIGKTNKNKKACIIDDCDTYFWAILKPKTSDKQIKKIQEKIEQVSIKSTNRESKVIKTELHNKNFLGEQVKAIKVFVTNHKDIHEISHKIPMKYIDKRREKDIPFITRYVIEKNLKPLHWYEIDGEFLNNSPEFNGIDASLNVDICIKAEEIKQIKDQEFFPKILAYDIETAEVEIGRSEILMVSLVGENFKKVLTCKEPSKQPYVEHFKSEADMLLAFVKYVKQYDPDILTGYFSDGFDLPYLRARAKKNKIKLNLGIDNSQPVFSRGRMLSAKIKGIVHVDLYRFIRTVYAQYLKSETLSLDEVAGELLGEKKTDFNATEAVRANKIDWQEFYKYNLQDSVLTYKLTEKLWPDLLEVTKIVQEPLFNTSRAGLSSLVENYILHNLNRFNEIAEKKPIHEEISERRSRESVEGAYVLEPTPGLYDNLAVFDFTSMHTSIIVTFNLSKATLLSKKQKNCFESPELEFENKKTRFYFSKKPGFFPTLLKEIFEKRKQFKQEFKKDPNPITKARSNVFKLLSASVHGYQGFFGARYYSLEASATVLAFVRKFNKEIIDKTNKQGYKAIYADTDSVVFALNKHTEKQALELLKKINNQLPGIMELDLEGFFKRGLWVTKRTGDFGAKKKYAMINKNNEIKIRGFETVRRDWCYLARETQNKILQLILKDGNEKKALEYLKQAIKKLKNREIPLKQLIIKTQLKKPIDDYKAETPHITIARKMRSLGLPINIGMIIRYYIAESTKTKKKALVRERAKLPNEPGQYDIEYYLKNQILPSVENIMEVFNLDVNELVEGKQQKKLFDF